MGQDFARIPLGWMTALLIFGCASHENHPGLEQIQEATSRAGQGISWIGFGTDARGRSYSILQRDLRILAGPTPEVWVRRDDGRGTDSSVADHLWRFDCRARTTQIRSEKLYHSGGSIRSTRNLDEASMPVAPQTVESELLEAVCAGADSGPTRIQHE